jgi:pyruvate formate lyase activating enzyme
MQAEPQRTWREILRFLESRKGLLDAVVFSGGEPTLQPALFDAVQNVRELGFRVGLHTAGMAMKRFAALLPWIDWVGFDVKASFDVYSRITGAEQSGDQALASLRLLLASKVAYEVRTTVHPALLTSEDLLELQAALLSLGVTHYTIQHARTPAQQAQRLPSLFETSRLILPSGYGDKFARFSER